VALAIAFMFVGAGVRRDRARMIAFGLAGLVCAALVVPYIRDFLLFRATPESEATIVRNGMTFTHRPVPVLEFLRLFVLVAVFVYFHRRRAYAIMPIVAIMLAALILENTQVLTGVDIISNQFGYFVLAPLQSLVATITGAEIIARLPLKAIFPVRFVRLYGALVTIAILAWAVHLQAGYSARWGQTYTISGDTLDAYRWFDAHTPVDSVVGTDSEITDLLLGAYTHAYEFVPSPFATVATTSEALDRLFIICHVYGVSSEWVKNEFTASTEKPPNDRNLAWLIYQDQFLSIGLPGAIPTDLRDQITTQYELQQLTPETLRRYRLNYLWYGPNERAIGPIPQSSLPYLTPVYSNASVTIYRIETGLSG
jgi:hypothetical protein